MLNNVDIKELEKKFICNIGPFEGIEYNSLLITALKQNKIKSFSLINNYFPDNNQLFLINYVFEKRTNKNKTLDWIINNPNNNTIEKMKQRETNFKEYMDDKFFRKKLGI
jgi:hypothetical protein